MQNLGWPLIAATIAVGGIIAACKDIVRVRQVLWALAAIAALFALAGSR